LHGALPALELLLDTCALLWLAADPDQLSSVAREEIENSASVLTLSAISGFEVSLLHLRGRVRMTDEPEIWFANAISSFGITAVPISWRMAMNAVRLPSIHKDPADRIIVATALERGAAIVTPDQHIAQYPGVRVIW
jgi:PIN domain nuclease of toxin-antitoxin system